MILCVEFLKIVLEVEDAFKLKGTNRKGVLLSSAPSLLFYPNLTLVTFSVEDHQRSR